MSENDIKEKTKILNKIIKEINDTLKDKKYFLKSHVMKANKAISLSKKYKDEIIKKNEEIKNIKNEYEKELEKWNKYIDYLEKINKDEKLKTNEDFKKQLKIINDEKEKMKNEYNKISKERQNKTIKLENENKLLKNINNYGKKIRTYWTFIEAMYKGKLSNKDVKIKNLECIINNDKEKILELEGKLKGNKNEKLKDELEKLRKTDSTSPKWKHKKDDDSDDDYRPEKGGQKIKNNDKKSQQTSSIKNVEQETQISNQKSKAEIKTPEKIVEEFKSFDDDSQQKIFITPKKFVNIGISPMTLKTDINQKKFLSLQENMSALKQKFDYSKIENDEYKKQLELKNKEIVDINKKYDALLKSYNNKNLKEEQFDKKMDELENIRSNLEKDIFNKEQFHELNIQNLKNIIQEQQTRIQIMNDDKQNFKLEASKNFDKLNKEYMKKIKVLDDELNKNKKDIENYKIYSNNLEQKLKAATDKFINIEHNYHQQKAFIETQSNELNQIKNVNANLLNNIKQMEQSNFINYKQLEKYKRDYENTINSNIDNQKLINEYQDMTQLLNKTINERDKALQKLEQYSQKHNQLINDYENKKIDNQQLMTHIDKLQKQIQKTNNPVIISEYDELNKNLYEDFEKLQEKDNKTIQKKFINKLKETGKKLFDMVTTEKKIEIQPIIYDKQIQQNYEDNLLQKINQSSAGKKYKNLSNVKSIDLNDPNIIRELSSYKQTIKKY